MQADDVAGAAAYDVGPVRQLTPAQEDAIETIAALPEGRGKVAAFLRCVLGERSYFEIAVMSHWLKDDKPLNEREMRYIAERWHATADVAAEQLRADLAAVKDAEREAMRRG